MEAFFVDRVYAISGGASGIGLATAKALLRYGARVSIADIRIPETLQGELSVVAAAVNEEVNIDDVLLLQTVDVRSRDAVDTWIDDTVYKFGALDGAANLAGTIPKDHNVGTIETQTDEDWDFVFGVNVYGVMNCLRAQMKYIGKDGARKGGSVVNAGSGLSLQGRAGTSAYTASKHAVLGLTRCVAKEVGGRGVRVNCIAPGFTETPLMKQSQSIEGSGEKEDISTTALGRFAQPHEIADTIRQMGRLPRALATRSQFIVTARQYSATPAPVPEEPKTTVSPRWLSDTKARIGKCITFGMPQPLVDEAGKILRVLGTDWRNLVAGSEGYLTDKERAGLHRQGIVWGEQDSMGHVNNVMYVRFAESGRCNWTRNIGQYFDPVHKSAWEDLLTNRGIGLILKSITVDFKFPMTWPDRISVYHKLRSRPDESTQSMVLDVMILSEGKQRPAARCLEDVVVYDYQQGKKSRLESFMLDQFKQIFDLQEAAKTENLAKIRAIEDQVRFLETESWDRPDAKEDLGSAAAS